MSEPKKEYTLEDNVKAMQFHLRTIALQVTRLVEILEKKSGETPF